MGGNFGIFKQTIYFNL